MARHRRRKTDDTAVLILGLTFLLPPVGNVVYQEWRDRWAPGASVDDPSARVAELERQVTVLRRRLQVREQDLAAVGAWDAGYAPRVARALPLGDLSPQRHAFWIAAKDGGEVRASSVVASGGALAGRVHRGVTGTAVAVVRSVLDPEFVVRFRYGSTWGFLRGTGRLDEASGRPLLAIELLNSRVPFQEGEPVFSDGGDGVFPRDMLIGRLVRAEDDGDLPRFEVLSEVALDSLGSLVILVDRHVAAARRVEDGLPGRRGGGL